MSFILDALKKSEADRQRQSTPGIADVAEGRDKASSPRWIWVLAALLGVNLVVLAYLLLRPDPQPPGESRSVLLQPPVTETQPSGDVEPLPEESASFSDMVAEAKKRQPEAIAAPAPVDPPVADPPTPEPRIEEPPPAPAPAAPSTRTTVYPTFNELRARGNVQLPDLHIDIHVYNEQPSKRFVFVNMSKYAERATLEEGPRVKEIVPEGVILEHRGEAFLLPRQ